MTAEDDETMLVRFPVRAWTGTPLTGPKPISNVQSAPNPYCEGNTGREMGQGESLATSPHPLV